MSDHFLLLTQAVRKDGARKQGVDMEGGDMRLVSHTSIAGF